MEKAGKPYRCPGKGALGRGNRSAKALRLGHAWGARGAAGGWGAEAEGAQGEREEMRARRGQAHKGLMGFNSKENGEPW